MRPRTAVLALLSTGLFGSATVAERPPTEDGLRIVDVRLEEVVPGSPVQRLSVALRNPDARIVSRLAFSVRVDGRELPVYRDLVFLDEIPGGATARVELFHLTEPGPVEIKLREAWTVEVLDSADERRQRPLEPVPGLPVTASSAHPSAEGALP